MSAPRASRGCGKDVAFVVIVGIVLGLAAIVLIALVQAVLRGWGWF